MAIQPNPQIMFPNFGVQSPELGTVYVNGIAVLFSPWDFSFVFLRTLPSESPGGIEGEHQFDVSSRAVQSVVMSPQHAKAMLKALSKNIHEYEDQHGPIPDIRVADLDSATRQIDDSSHG